MKSNGIIYKAENIINGKIYIGKTTKTLGRRRSLHIYNSKKRTTTVLAKALNKYGIENFTWEILFNCFDKTTLSETEKYFIILYNSKLPHGYNMTDGGDGAPYGDLNPSKRKEVRDKLSILFSGSKNPMYGRSAWKGKKHTVESRIQMSNQHKGIATGPMSDATKAKMRESHKSIIHAKGKNSQYAKKYVVFSPCGIKHNITGLKQFCRENNLIYQNMGRVLRGERTHCKGWRIYHVED